MKPAFTLDKIKFSIDPPTFERAVGLYDSGKVKNVSEDVYGHSSTVIGTQPYRVSMGDRGFDYSNCTCYLGQNNTLCKHVVALAFHIIKKGGPLSKDDKKQHHKPVCSGERGMLADNQLQETKKKITDAMKYIKAYVGPSRTWFKYQESLSEGCARLSEIVSTLPVNKQTAGLLVNMLLRLDKKLRNTVDDSDGTVGDFMMQTVEVLVEFYMIDKQCAKAYRKLENREAVFDWEEPLVGLFD
jgi:hypothetical protein